MFAVWACKQSYYGQSLVCYCHNLLKCWSPQICLPIPIIILWWAWTFWQFLKKVQLVYCIFFISGLVQSLQHKSSPRMMKALKHQNIIILCSLILLQGLFSALVAIRQNFRVWERVCKGEQEWERRKMIWEESSMEWPSWAIHLWTLIRISSCLSLFTSSFDNVHVALMVN